MSHPQVDIRDGLYVFLPSGMLYVMLLLRCGKGCEERRNKSEEQKKGRGSVGAKLWVCLLCTVGHLQI